MSDEELQNINYNQIGKFVVEFEAMLLSVKEFVIENIEERLLKDIIPIDILMYDATAYPLSEYFKGVAIFLLDMKIMSLHRKAPKIVLDSYKSSTKELINEISKQIKKSGELRNDLIHATHQISSAYSQLTLAYRIKITSSGVEYRKLNLIPGILDNPTEYFRILKRMIFNISFLLQWVPEYPIEEYMNPEDNNSFKSFDFDEYRKTLFVVDEAMYTSKLRVS